jgi:predicted GIY-YIG superfamily endonuclease
MAKHSKKGRETPPQATTAGGIYVLELEGGCVYVGKSSNIQRRLQQHMERGGKKNGFIR